MTQLNVEQAVEYNKSQPFSRLEVQQIQAVVGAVPPDGLMGPKTVRGIAEWQTAHNITADGKIWSSAEGNTWPPMRAEIQRQLSARVVGFDSYSPVSAELFARAHQLLGQAPAFCGRYFSAPGSKVPAYQAASENPVFSAAGVRVLPVARQTNRVGGTHAQGQADGENNAAALQQAFAGGGPLKSRTVIFLDVEPAGTNQPRLSSEYYQGWCQGLSVDSNILPGVYMVPGDSVSQSALQTALATGATCIGLWVSRPCSQEEPALWDESMTRPIESGSPPALLWQYSFPETGGLQVDRDMLAPTSDLLTLMAQPTS